MNKTSGITDQMIADQFRWYDPARIILFGSHARGEPAADIDVAIIKETSDRFLDRLKDVYESWTLPVAVDILSLYTDGMDADDRRGTWFHPADSSRRQRDLCTTQRLKQLVAGNRP